MALTLTVKQWITRKGVYREQSNRMTLKMVRNGGWAGTIKMK